MLDKFLRKWRFSRAASHVPLRARLLDIGSEDGTFIRSLQNRIDHAVGMDPAYAKAMSKSGYKLIPGRFPRDIGGLQGTFQAITMIAVIEHLPAEELEICVRSCAELLDLDGLVIITMPSPRVDKILYYLKKAGLVQARTLDEHYGLEPDLALQAFLNGPFDLLVSQKFQFGLNNLFVFKRRL